MQKQMRSILNAIGFIGFTAEEARLLRHGMDAVSADPVLLLRFEADCAELARVDGSTSIAPADDPLYPALVLLSRFDDVRENYARLGIGEHILHDTFSDIPLWIRHCKRVFGYYGLKKYRWLTNYTRMRLFRLGRLEFICADSEVPAYIYREPDGSLRSTATEEPGKTAVLAPGMSVIEVHIPEGPAMEPAEITQSLNEAPVFFKEKFGRNDFSAFVCESWLMTPCFSELIPGSNLDQFQKRFFKVPFTDDDSQMFERLYDCRRDRVPDSFDGLPMDTHLRRAMRAYYARGGKCPQMWGVIPIEEERGKYR